MDTDKKSTSVAKNMGAAILLGTALSTTGNVLANESAESAQLNLSSQPSFSHSADISQNAPPPSLYSSPPPAVQIGGGASADSEQCSDLAKFWHTAWHEHHLLIGAAGMIGGLLAVDALAEDGSTAEDIASVGLAAGSGFVVYSMGTTDSAEKPHPCVVLSNPMNN